MKFIDDYQIYSHYSIATSKKLPSDFLDYLGHSICGRKIL